MKKLFSLLSAFLLSAAFTQASDPTLAGTVWQLTDVGGLKVVDLEKPPFILLTDIGGNLKGNSSCNSFTGTYEGTGDGLKFGPIAATKMACPEPQMKIETALLEALGYTRKYAIVDGVLHLEDEKGETLATFEWVVEEE